jgi:hypothetical protein
MCVIYNTDVIKKLWKTGSMLVEYKDNKVFKAISSLLFLFYKKN